MAAPITPRTLPCKVCGGRSTWLYHREIPGRRPPAIEVYVCGRCGLLFVGNTPTDAELRAFYETASSDECYDESEEAAVAKAVRSARDVGALLGRDDLEPSVLDVGCGYGHFLVALRDRRPGVRAVGLELPERCLTACREKGLEVHGEPLETVTERFSGIVLLDVAEHVPDPNATFAACFERVREGGFVYVHTPRRCFWDTVAVRGARLPVMRRFSSAWLKTRVSIGHLHLWTDRALRLSLERAGFQVDGIRAECEFSWPLDRYFRIYFGQRRRIPRPVLRAAAWTAEVVFVRLGTLRNKAICVARRPPGGAPGERVPAAAAASGA